MLHCQGHRFGGYGYGERSRCEGRSVQYGEARVHPGAPAIGSQGDLQGR